MKLYAKDAAGNIRYWDAKGVMAADRSHGRIKIEHGIIGGSPTSKIVNVTENKSGRDLYQQIQHELQSRINKQKDKGYVEDIDEAKFEKKTNGIGMPKPMLAVTYEMEKLKTPYYVQYKYNGNRCMIFKESGQVVAYSRNGKIINSIQHILDACKDMPEGTILDGELYKHTVPLQTLRSWISKRQADSNGLEYIVYDIVSPEAYPKRLESLKKLNLGYPITLAVTEEINGGYSLIERLESAIKAGFEGLMVRIGNNGYEDGKRSKSLRKVKAWKDCELRVVGISASNDGWAILHCNYNGKVVKVSCPGDIHFRHHVLDNLESYIGRRVTIKYAELTEDGIPFHPVALAFREGNE